MRYLHTMVRVADVEQSLHFYRDLLGLEEVRRIDNEKGRFTLIFLAAPADKERSAAERSPELELTFNWDPEDYDGGRNFGHLAYKVDDIYAACQRLMDGGVTINRPPRDGHMAFVRSPDGISIELLQEGDSLPAQEPWASMPNTGSW
ncbi:MAG: VOC family protein [Geminicoccaceae bacterium]